MKARQVLSITLTLFAVFFGAGNMIFPPAMGQQAGEHYIQALAGFIVTDAGIALLGMIAVVLVGTEVSDLGELVGRRFAIFLSVCIYLLIGPLFALPRTGSVSFELAVRPYLTEPNVWWVSLIVTGIFFGLTYYLSGNPKKVVNLIGKYLTPVLLICIVLIFLACVFMEKSPHGRVQYGSIGAPRGAYAEIPFFQGMIEGYYALDGPAGLVFAIIIINAVRGFQVHEKKNIIKYTLFCGAGAALILSVVYYMLTYIGAVTQTPFSNGGTLLHAVASDLLGPVGGIVLGVAVFFCVYDDIHWTDNIFCRLFPRTVSEYVIQEDHSNCLSVQFCDQQHRFGYAGTGIASGSDDDLSGDRCACDSFVFQEVDWKSKDGICTGNAVCVLCCFCRRDAKCENYAGSCYRILPAAAVL